MGGLSLGGCVEDFDWDFPPSLDDCAVEELAAPGLLARKPHLVITGKPGTSKSHIFGAIALRACIDGLVDLHVGYIDRHTGLADGSYEPHLHRWSPRIFRPR